MNTSKTSSTLSPNVAKLSLKAGDRVWVRSREEIEATLDSRNELKGCVFMSEMWRYCGTEQCVLKPMDQFLDERTYRVRKTRGIVLLEGAVCQGTEYPKGCDRSCFFFWRKEWLAKIE
jgi:hypothetical protein